MNKIPSLMEMISKLIATPSVSSVSPEFDMGNIDVIHQLANWLHDAGFDINIQPLPDHPDKANLIATLGSGEDGLVLSGHTDTVPYDEGRWRFNPFAATESDGKLFGLGTSDMKSFLALAAIAATSFDAKTLKRPITILATADEESSMEGAKLIANLGERLGRYCIIGEPTNLIPVRQHKGILMEAIRLKGRSGHSSNPDLGNNALEGMNAVIGELLNYRNELQTQNTSPAFDVPVPTLNLGHIHGGDNPNRICAECELHIDLRPLPGMEIEVLRGSLRDRVKRIAEKAELGCEFITLFDGIPAMDTPKDSPIVRIAEQLTGHSSSAVAFGTEGPYFNRMGTDTIILGPGDIAQAHQPDEYLSLDRIEPMMRLLHDFIRKFCI